MTPKQEEQFINIINSMIPDDTGEAIKEEDIDNYINNVAYMPMFSGLSDEDKQRIRKKIHETHRVRLERGVAIVSRDHKKWFPQRKPSLELNYWNRFKQYLKADKHFSTKVINGMDLDTDEIVDLLGNPNIENAAQRRGLIIGDVQSGKTANYSGVICKAVDAGYRVIILLTGTSNDLRRQTQIRLDEAFLGYDSAAVAKQNNFKFIGAGKYNESLQPIAATNVNCDFNKKATQFSMGLPTTSTDTRPMLFVCKKNVSVLHSLYDWIVSNNKHGESKIDNTLLMIDDESDYASINTRANDDPTATNKWIRNILNSFRFASYVGFTATPYANIFIDPESNEAMENEDLFPADYIYTLESPSNYIGARDIFGPTPNHNYMLREIDDGEEFYPFRHKKDADFRYISPSLKDAIYTFLIANVIRDLDKDENSYRSMMINVSRFVNTQNLLYDTVKKEVENVQKAIKAYSHLPVNEALDDEYIHTLYDTFENEFSDTDYSWNEIQANLERSVVINPIMVLCANQGNKDLDYSKYSEKIRAIVIGGQALSRGLTLEGLMVSYIYRHSLAYDTLMQMGRWFGYRDGYDKYCRIYMDPESIAWYSTISDATDELRREIKRMRERGAIPLEFGLKVREDPETPLIVTARNKMRSARERVFSSSLSGIMVETQSLYSDDAHNATNLNAIRELFNNADQITKDKKRVALLDVSRNKIIDFLRRIQVSELNTRFDPIAISEFLIQYAGNELLNWDVLIASGNGEEYNIADNISVNVNRRQVSLVRDEKFLLLNKNRLGGPTDMSFGLTDEQKLIATLDENGNKRKNPSANDYLKEEIGSRKPLLIIYLVEPTAKGGERITELNQYPAVGFSIGIPHLRNQMTRFIRYRVNRIYQAYGDTLEDGGDEYGEENGTSEETTYEK